MAIQYSLLLNRRLLCAALACAWAIMPAMASGQTDFAEVTPPNDDLFVTPDTEDFWMNAAAPADVDGDGDTDLAVIGFYVVYHVSAVDRLVIFLNDGPDTDGNWQFSRQEVPLNGISSGSSDLAWGDYDGDGDPDLAVGSDGVTAIFRNDGGTLVETAIALPGYHEDSGYTGAYDLRSLTWADVDNDADLDLLIPTVINPTTFDFETHLMRNDGTDGKGGWVFTDTGFPLDATMHAHTAWADDDQDGDLDLLVTNVDQYFRQYSFIRRYENQPGGLIGSDLLGIHVEHGLADWGDYDADGDLDVLVAGNIQEADGTYDTVLRVYRNNGGTYTEETLTTGPSANWLDIHAATWADYDSDGDVDILLTGNYVGDSKIVGKSDIYERIANGWLPLKLNLPAPVDSIGRGGAFLWFDIDDDGDLDYFVGGGYYVPGGNGLVEAQMHLYENLSIDVNNDPDPPGLLRTTVNGSDVEVTWSPSLDDSTPIAGMTYDLQLRQAGQRGLPWPHQPEPGNISAVLSWQLKDLEDGTYTLGLRGVDSAFNASLPAEHTFTIGLADVLPEGDKLLDGVVAGGTMQNLFASDDQYLKLNPAPTKNPNKQKVHLVLQSTSPTVAPAALEFRIEARMTGGPVGDVLQKVELHNYVTGQPELVDVRPASNGDQPVVLAIAGDPTRFVQPGTREMTAHVTWVSDSFSGAPFNWFVEIDQAIWQAR